MQDRTAGDTCYHLRYYKTGMCVHDTDTRGMCVKNGPHCAFAHGVEDVRPPVYDIREIQVLEMMEQEGLNGSGPNNLDKERNMVNDDPKWQDTSYVLANYKTEQCKRPPRLCRQGYACPQYHNSRDRRRSPKKFKYRSTACPNVKHGDEWGEPSNCDNGDSCQYCHTRTEQQFHPEIYKSTKCNDIQQNGYCPRGAFCAFAHLDQEMTQVRETAASENCTGTSLADILQSALPADNHLPSHSSSSCTITSQSNSIEICKSNHGTSVSNNSDSVFGNGQCHPAPILAPIGSKPRHYSGSTTLSGSSETLGLSSSLGGSGTGVGLAALSSYHNKAPGSEREDRESAFKKQLAAIDNDQTLDPIEKAKRKQNLLLSNMIPSQPPVVSLPVSVPATPSSSFVSSLPSSLSSTVSPLAPPFYPTSDTVESVVGLLGSSAPVNIPGSSFQDRSSGLVNNSSSTSSPAFPHSFLQSSLHRENSLDQGASAFLGANGVGKLSGSGCFASSSGASGCLFDLGANMSPHTRNPLSNPLSQSPLVTSFTPSSNSSSTEVQRLREELASSRAKYVSKIAAQQKEMEDLRAGRLGPYVQALHPHTDLEKLPLHTLKAIQTQLRQDLETIEKAINNYGVKSEQWPGAVTTW
ncbi:RING finger protein unkempt-like isoform X2 [Macrobrachium rosenbergii]|uniref:RING finger protein unkempt-like isoform X2 n=1 Tax=Macrobrachium rosenbergii TaxID=79674 RepID=UPI0034D56272